MESITNSPDLSWIPFHPLLDPRNLLAEYQFAFIALVCAYNFEGFEQWKSMTHMMTHAAEAMKQLHHASLFLDYLSILQSQLRTMPDDFARDVLLGDNFVLVCLKVRVKIFKNDISLDYITLL
jgi:hypothetical protein